MRGFKTLKTAYATIKGFEVMRALRKGQAGMFALEGGIVGEARLVERAFGVGPCALAEVMKQFSKMPQIRVDSADTWMSIMNNIPEARVKEVFASLLSEPTKKRLGGESKTITFPTTLL